MKKYTKISRVAFGLGLLLIALPIIHVLIPVSFDLMIAIFIGVPIVIILSLIALVKKNERKLLAVFSLFLAFMMLGWAIILLYVPNNKFSNVTYLISQLPSSF